MVSLKPGVVLVAEVKPKLLSLSLDIFKSSAYRIPARELSDLAKQLGMMFRGGVAILDMFDILLSASTNRRLSEILRAMREEIRGGRSFSEAFEKFKDSFGELFVNLVKVGETSGTLDEVFLQLHKYYSKQADLKIKVVNMLIYPVLVLIVSLIVLLIAFFFVVPKFEAIFLDIMPLDELPFLTRLVFKTSHLVREKWPFLLIGGIALLAIFKFILQRTDLRKTFEKLLLKVPLIGKALRFYYATIFLSSLALMLNSGIPILTSLDMSSRATDSVYFRERIEEAMDKVQRGISLSKALVETGLFEPIVQQFILSGEKSGNLYEMLLHANEYYNSEIEVLLDRIMRIMEPVLIVVLGSFVFALLLSLYLPLFMLPGKLMGR